MDLARQKPTTATRMLMIDPSVGETSAVPPIEIVLRRLPESEAQSSATDSGTVDGNGAASGESDGGSASDGDYDGRG